jgi:DNA modification methylase
MTTDLKVEYLPLAEIKPYKSNPRKHADKQVQQIANSIKEFRFNNPLLVDENGEIIAGHGRFMAAQSLNIESVPVIRLSHLTPNQKRLYRIADNKLTENGQWDVDLLKFEFAEIEALDLDIDLNITGFETGEIDLMMTHKAANEKLNSVPFISENEIVSKVGDVWQLGPHKIICGDSLKKETFDALMPNQKADMVFTDPPYNVEIDGHVCGNGATKHKDFAMASGEMNSLEFQNFLRINFELLKEFTRAGSIHFICMDWRHCKEVMLAAEGIYNSLKNICVWNKDNGGMGSLYRSKHEFIFVYKNGASPHINNIELGKHGRYRTNVWDYAGVNSFGKNRDDLKLHPTVKPVEMIMDAIMDISKRSDIVLDSFLGSGSTLIAAEKAKRICYGIELEPLYIDTTIRRWEDFTKQDAVLLSNGKTYKELLKEKADVK